MPQNLKIWPPLSSAYNDVFGEIDLDVYHAAGEIWQRVRTFARAHGIADDAFTHTVLIRAVARVSNRRKQPAVNLESPGPLKGYLFKAFKNCLLDEIRDKHSSTEINIDDLEAVADESEDSLAARIERKIMLEEIVRHMDAKTRFIYEHLILGYSFEEIAEISGTQSNLLRSLYSKRLRKIASEFSDVSASLLID